MSTLAFRAAFAAATLAAVAVAGACGDGTKNGFDEPTPIDGGQPAKDASVVPPPPEDAEPPPDAADADAATWPTCDAKPAGASAKTIPQIWQDNPLVETETWISGAYVTAVSGGGCKSGKACQIFLQADPTYATMTAAAKHGIKMFVSGLVAARFTGVAVGDRVDALGWAWRYARDGQHELLVEVNAKLPGCAKTTSTGNALTPIEGVALSDLTLDVYENTHGPLFVKVADVAGKPDASPTTTFGLWSYDDGGFDSGADGGANIVSLSPFFLPTGAFTGLMPGVTTRFSSIAGVFGLFVPSGGPKYLELYPRTSADIVLAQ